MRWVICGGRKLPTAPAFIDPVDGRPYREWISAMLQGALVTEVFSGAQSGADALGEHWAWENGHAIRRFKANWDRFGHIAGPKRNAEMAAAADGVLVLPGNAGTRDMWWRGVRRGLVVHVHPAMLARYPDGPRQPKFRFGM